MNYQEWLTQARNSVQQIAIGVDDLVFLLNDPNAKQYLSSLSQQQKQQIQALISAIHSLHAALSPEIRKLLGIY